MDFEQGLGVMYEDLDVVDYFEELAKLKQEGNAFDAYLREFMRLFNQVHGLLEEFLVSCFISGLRELVKLELPSK